MAIKAVVFDAFGTLVKFSKNHNKKPYKSISNKAAFNSDKAIHNPMIMNYNLLQYANALNVELTDDELSLYKSELDDELKHMQLFPEVNEVLNALKNSNIKIFVASNLAVEYNDKLIKILSTKDNEIIDRYFLSNQMMCKKPDSKFYTFVNNYINSFGINKDEILMVGDNFKNDYEAPIAFGWKALYLNRKNTGIVTIDTISRLNSIFLEIKK